MNSWTFFAYLFDTFDVRFLAAVQGNADRLVAAVQVPLAIGVTLWLAGTTAVDLFQPNGEPLMILVRRGIRAALVLGVVGAAGYTAIFETFMLTTLPNELTAAVSGAPAAGAITPAAFDKLLQGGWVGISEILKNLSIWEVKTLVLGLIAGILFIVGGFFVAIGFFLYMATHVMLGLAVEIGAIFACMLLWEKTLFLFNGWLSVMLALIVTQVLIVGLLSLLVPLQVDLLKQIVELNGPNGQFANDLGGQVHYMFEIVLLYFMIGYLSPKIERVAERMTSGAGAGIGSMSAWAHGMLATGARVAGSAATAAGASAAGSAIGSAGAAGMRSLRTAGRAP